MKIIKYILAPILFLVLINWSTDFKFIQLNDIRTVVIIILSTALLMFLGTEEDDYRVRFRSSIMVVGFLLTCMTIFEVLNREYDLDASYNVFPLYIKPLLLCLVLYPPLSLIAESYDLKKNREVKIFSDIAEEKYAWMESLSRREREVYELVRVDLSNGEIAEKLFISELTVKKHVYNIMKKANTSNREDLI